jgi:glycosyltransferase involved in cell wall biosynthesis
MAAMTSLKRTKLTIFTPSFNRAHLLPRLFDSIRQQVNAGDPVEWLIIDDGSTDETEAAIESFRAERPDLLHSARVPNGGKHRAINLAAHEARGEWMLFLDSDDWLAEDAVDDMLRVIRACDDRPDIGVARGLRRFTSGAQPAAFRLNSNPGKHADWVRRQRGFDTAELVRVPYLRLHAFPEHSAERFMAESWLWYSLDRTCLTLFVDREWTVCDYQPDGLSARSARLRAQAPLGAMDVYSVSYIAPLPWHMRARAAINWWRYRFHAAQLGHSEIRRVCPYWLAPLGWFLYCRDEESRT